MYRNTYAEINLNSIENNTKKIISKYNNYEYYFGVVKGQAYGHGKYVVDAMLNNGINYLAVSNLDEAIDIRTINNGIPILCLEPISPEHLEICEKNNITISVSSKEYVDKIKNLDLKLKIHIVINSGMNRLGFSEANELKHSIDILQNNQNFLLEGIFTHMGTLGISDIYWDKQLKSFKNITSLIDLGIFKIIHIDRSVTMMCHDKIPFCNGVRIGISIYGYNQLPIKQNNLKQSIKNLRDKLKIKMFNISKTNSKRDLVLEPAISLFSEVIEIRNVKKGEYIGYGGDCKINQDSTIAIVGIGYADGLDLNFSGGYVSINNKRYKVIGIINMGMISVIADNNIKVGDKVEIFGKSISIREYSSHCNTSIYKAMTTISYMLSRKYVKNNEVVKTVESLGE